MLMTFFKTGNNVLKRFRKDAYFLRVVLIALNEHSYVKGNIRGISYKKLVNLNVVQTDTPIIQNHNL